MPRNQDPRHEQLKPDSRVRSVYTTSFTEMRAMPEREQNLNRGKDVLKVSNVETDSDLKCEYCKKTDSDLKSEYCKKTTTEF